VVLVEPLTEWSNEWAGEETMLKSAGLSTDVVVCVLYLVVMVMSVLYLLDQAGIFRILPTSLR
jgi:hypothetical protein